MKIFTIVVVTVIIAIVSVGIVKAGGNTAYDVVYSRLPSDKQGPDEIFTIPQYNLVCVSKDGQLVCTCPCVNCAGSQLSAGVQSDPTAEPIKPTSEPIKPTDKPVKPTDEPIPTIVPTIAPTDEPTPIVHPNGIFIVHYDADGTQVWAKCMPESAWNGHQSHAGHLIQDLNLGPCVR